MITSEDFRKKRMARGLGLEDSARAMGMSKTTLVAFEKGLTNPHPKIRHKLVQFYERLTKKTYSIDDFERKQKKILRIRSRWDDLMYQDADQFIPLPKGQA